MNKAQTHYKIITDISEIEKLENTWEQLASVSHIHEIFQTWEWGFSYLNTHSNLITPYILLIEMGKNIIGLVPLCVQREKLFDILPVPIRIMTFLGGPYVSGEYLDVICSAEHHSLVMMSLFDALDSKLSGSFDIFRFPALKSDSITFRYLQNNSHDFIRLREIDFATMIIDLPERTDRIDRLIKKKMLANIRSRKNALLRKYPDYQVYFIEDPAELEPSIEQLRIYHQERWTAAGETGGMSTPEKIAFYKEITARLLPKKRLSFFRMDADRQMIAGHIGMIYGTKMYIHKSARCTKFDKYGAGMLRMREIIEKAISMEMKQLDLLRGEMKYKFDCGARPFICKTIEITKKKWVVLAYRLFDKAKPCLKKIRSRLKNQTAREKPL